MIPIIVEYTKNGEQVYDIFSRLVKDRIYFIKEPIETEMASTLCACLLFLDRQSTEPISIFINSPGGLIYPGLFCIYDTMNYIKSPVKTICIGESYSAASTVLMAGTKGQRKAFPNASIMLHNVAGGARGFSHEIIKEANRIQDCNERIIKIAMKHTGKSYDEVKSVMKEETYFSAEKALEWGIIDEIVEKVEE